MFTELPSDVVYWQSDVLWLSLKFPCDLALICLNITSLFLATLFHKPNDLLFPMMTFFVHTIYSSWNDLFSLCILWNPIYPLTPGLKDFLCEISFLNHFLRSLLIYFVKPAIYYLFIYLLIDLFINHLSIYPSPKVFNIFIYWINGWMVKWGDRGLMWENEQAVK